MRRALDAEGAELVRALLAAVLLDAGFSTREAGRVLRYSARTVTRLARQGRASASDPRAGLAALLSDLAGPR